MPMERGPCFLFLTPHGPPRRRRRAGPGAGRLLHSPAAWPGLMDRAHASPSACNQPSADRAGASIPLFFVLQEQIKLAHRYIPIGYFPPGIKENTRDDATIMSTHVLYGTTMILFLLWLTWWYAKHCTIQPPSVPIYMVYRCKLLMCC
jgi:hypothetical protein